MGKEELQWRHIDLNLLVAFSYLYRHRSVSIAAEHACVSQSAMSHSLARLRQLLGDALFERKGHQMCPTERAHQIAPKISVLLDTVSGQILQSEPFSPSHYQGVCRIGLTDYAELIFAPAIYDAIRSQAPHAQISLINVNRSNYEQTSEQEKLDIIIGSMPLLADGFSSQHLYTEQHVCLADLSALDSSIFSADGQLSLQSFAKVEHALVSPDGKLATQIDKILAEHGLLRQVTVASRNFLTIQTLLKGRALMAIVPKKMADLATEQGGLSMLEPPIAVADFDIAMIWPEVKTQDDKSRWLRSVLNKVLV